VKIILGSWIHRYLKRLGIFLITVALVMGLASCEGSCGAPSLYQYVLAIFSTVGGITTPGGEMTYSYDEGTVVNLVATPDEGYRFVEWSGDVHTIADVYAAETHITMSSDCSITANFMTVYELTTYSSEGGDVVISGEGTYLDGTIVTLEAVADECYEFVEWTGAEVADPYFPITTVTMDEAKSITAVFALLSYNLTVASTDGGAVTSPGEDTFPYDCGTEVPLVTTAEEGYYFANWSGDVDTIANVEAATTTITMNGDYSITANFEQIPPGQFTLIISSTAGGSVTTPGNGIFAYNEGATVNLTAEADEGYQFLKWTGNVSTISDVNSATTTITMNGDYSITANFEQIPPGQFTLIISSTAGGSVTTPGNGIFAYDEGATVNLAAEADEGYQFLKWTGNVSTISDVNSATTTIIMNGDYSITANFALPIWDWYDLDAIRDNLGGSYMLMNDLDSTTAGYRELASRTANSRKGWQPIGTTAENDKFAGSFDGQGHEICDLFINRPAESNVGLFGVIGGGGVIDNVGLVNVTVTGCSVVGGLAGQNEGPVSNSYSSGRVTGYSYVGGLAGHNSGNVSNSYSTGRVTGTSHVGGLAGQNEGPVNNSYSSGRVTGNSYVGGLAGHNSGNVSNSYSTGRVTGGWSVGGLAGQNEGPVSNSYSTGRVTGYSYVGGLAGHNSGNVSNSYSSGRVTGSNYVGGLAGQNEGTVNNSYSTGRVTGSNYVGGLVGQNKGNVSNSYSTGRVTGSNYVGGLVGQNESLVSNSFWNTQTSGQANSDGGTAKTTAEMKDIATFTAWDIIAVASGQTNPTYTWNIVDDETYPFLSWQ
jgi:hypothetical protein